MFTIAFFVAIVLVGLAGIAAGSYLMGKAVGTGDSPARRMAVIVALRFAGAVMLAVGLMVFWFIYLTTTDGFGR